MSLNIFLIKAFINSSKLYPRIKTSLMQSEQLGTILEKELLIEKCVKTLEDSKAHDLINIDLNNNSSIADNMMICTGTSNRHVSAIAQRLVDTLYKDGLKQIKVSGEALGEWVIVDTGTLMIHIMQQEVRERYELDDLYRCIASGTQE